MYDGCLAARGRSLTQVCKRYTLKERTSREATSGMKRGKYNHLWNRKQSHDSKNGYQTALQVEKILNCRSINEEWILFEMSFFLLLFLTQEVFIWAVSAL